VKAASVRVLAVFAAGTFFLKGGRMSKRKLRMTKRKLAALIAGLAAFVAAATAAAATVVVAPNHLDGWATVNDTCGAATTGSVSFVTGPASPPAGTGSVQFTVGSNGDSYPTVRTGNFNGVKLSDLTSLDYWTYVSHEGSGSQAPYIDLYVDNNNDGVRDDILTFEPVYNPTQGSVALNTWQHWTAISGLWWSDSLGGPPPLFTLTNYINGSGPVGTSHPDARILGGSERSLILAAGCGAGAWASFVGNADKLTVGVQGANTTFDFEQAAPGPGHGRGHAGKVTICHKGHTITVSRNALPAHLRHGDHEGACSTSSTRGKKK
jgi:hypothetical protein